MLTKKKLLKIIMWVLIAIVVLAATVIVITLLTPLSDTNNLIGRDDVSLCPVDYDENIFEDEGYMSKPRDVFFTFDGMGEYVTENNKEDFEGAGKMFCEYFKCIIEGDYQSYPDFYTREFKAKAALPEKFTMQKIYDISAELIGRVAYEDGYMETYSVGYRIMDNNGTFRSDLNSRELIPLVYTVYVTESGAWINGIATVQSK